MENIKPRLTDVEIKNFESLEESLKQSNHI